MYEICIAGIQAGYQAEKMAGILGWPYVGRLDDVELEKYKIILFFGVDGWVVDKCMFLKNPKKIVLWVGTDTTFYNFIRNLKQIPFLIHITTCERLKNDLLNEGIKMKALIGTVAENYNLEALPEKFSVLCYQPDWRDDFFDTKLILEVAQKLPDMLFRICGRRLTDLPFHPKNVFNWGWVEGRTKYDLFEISSCLLRIPKHDGISQVMIEMFQMGRYVIHNYSYPFVWTCNNTIESIMANLKIIRKQIVDLRKIDKEAKFFRKPASKYYREKYSFERIKKQYEDLLKEILK